MHLVRLSEGKELPWFQHFRSTKTSNKFLNAWGKIISAENMWVACMDRLHLSKLTSYDMILYHRNIKVHQSRYLLLFVCLFDLILYVPSTIFQLYRDRSSWVEPVLS